LSGSGEGVPCRSVRFGRRFRGTHAKAAGANYRGFSQRTRQRWDEGAAQFPGTDEHTLLNTTRESSASGSLPILATSEKSGFYSTISIKVGHPEVFLTRML